MRSVSVNRFHSRERALPTSRGQTASLRASLRKLILEIMLLLFPLLMPAPGRHPAVSGFFVADF